MARIKITASNPVTGILTLDDNGRTKVNHNEHVTWHLGNDCGVLSITSISAKLSPPSADIWSTTPHQDGNSTNWQGTINATAAGGSEWNYNMVWTATNGTTPPPFDPKIILNS